MLWLLAEEVAPAAAATSTSTIGATETTKREPATRVFRDSLGGSRPASLPPGPQAPRGPGMDTTTGVAVSIPGTRNSSGGLSVGAFRGPETWPTRGTRSAKGKQRYRTSSVGRSASAELFGSASGTASVPDASDPPARPRPPRPPSPSAPLIIWAPIFFAVCDGGGYWGDPPP